MAVILAYAPFGGDFTNVGELACKMASSIKSIKERYQFFKMLAECGFIINSTTTRKELLKDVKPDISQMFNQW
jgi:hypothetical protein